MSSMGDVAACVCAAQVLRGLVHPMCELLQPLCGLSLAKAGKTLHCVVAIAPL